MKQDIVSEKSFNFAIRIINLYKKLAHHNKEYVLSKQLLKSGTSVGANIREAKNGESKADLYIKWGLLKKNVMKLFIG